MKKMDFKEKKYRQPRFNAGMAGEKMLDLIGKYIVLDFIFMALGLIHSSDGLRGFPVSWLGSSGNTDTWRFVVSLLIITALVIAGDIITRVAIRFSEPESKVQQTLNQYSSSYTEYEDPVVVTTVSSPRSKHVSTKNKSYEDVIASEYNKVRTLIKSADTWADSDEGKKSPAVISKMLNGKEPASGKDGQKKTGGIAFTTILVVIFAIVSVLGGLLESDDDYSDDGWDSGSYDEYYYAAESVSDGLLYDMTNGDISWYENIAGDDPSELRDIDDWETSTYQEIFMSADEGTDPQTMIVRYQVDTDKSYLVSFRFEGDPDDLSEDDLTGFAITEFPEDEDGYALTSFGDTHREDSPYEDDEFDEYSAEMLSRAVTTGNCYIDDMSILFW